MLRCVRTTIQLPDDLFHQAKQAALNSSRTFTQLVEDALRAALTTRPRPTAARPAALPTSPGAPRPGVDLDDSAALLDVMESGDDPL
jgi:hypothetical protein